jgi:mono/diheme cytochrome c family protein
MRRNSIFLSVTIAVFAVVAFFSFSEVNSQQTAKKATPEMVKRGQYLVNAGGCNDCHSPKVMTPMGPMPDSTRLLSGHPASEKIPELPAGIIGPDKWGAVTNNSLTAWYGPWGISYAANITPDNVTGIGAWTEDVFVKTMRTGKHMGAGRPILPPMPWFNLANLTDEDLKSIFAYLKSIKPISNEVPLPVPPTGAK